MVKLGAIFVQCAMYKYDTMATFVLCSLSIDAHVSLFQHLFLLDLAAAAFRRAA